MDELLYFEQFIGLDDIEEVSELVRPAFREYEYEVKRYQSPASRDTDNLYVLSFWIHDSKEFYALEDRLEAVCDIMDDDFGNYFVVRPQSWKH